MKQKNYLLLLIVLLCTSTITFAQTNPENQIIVYFISGVQKNEVDKSKFTITSANISRVLQQNGVAISDIKKSFPNFNEADTVKSDIGESSRQMNFSNLYTIILNDKITSKSNLLKELNNMPEVLYAEPDGRATTNLIPFDGRFGNQWGLRNVAFPGRDIHAEQAWDIFTGNPNSIIAIIDAGVDVDHDDLQAKINGGDVGFTLGNDALGNFSHGSHVAGIAAAVTNNAGNNGVAGVDWAARIHPRNVINNGSSDNDISQAIINSVNFSPNVWTLNHSWSLINPDNSQGRYSTTVRAAFAHAYKNNRVSCAAMGNFHTGAVDANDVTAYPVGFNSGIIAVGATNNLDVVTGFSARGPHVDVSAPGQDILSTNFDDGYRLLSGTSMATPHVSGISSLLKGFNTNLANDDIEQIIRLTADDQLPAGWDNRYGTGRVNAQRALQSLQAPNQLYQWNATGGTIVSTGGSEVRTFLGVPGLADAAYTVKRSEVQKTVNFPLRMCNIVGIWGRGVGTTGYREEFGRCFGEGICEVVPGTVTNTSVTLRTWIYEVWSASGQYIGFYPKSAANVVFQYTVLGPPAPNLITGLSKFCSGTSQYTLNNMPVGGTLTWTSSNTNYATVMPTVNPTTVTKIANANAFVTLTATTNACGVTQNITKIVALGFPAFTDTIMGTKIATPNGIHTYSLTLPLTYPTATYTWRVPSGWVIQSGQGTSSLRVRAGTTGGNVEVDLTACGVTRGKFAYIAVGPGGGDPEFTDPGEESMLRASPNPAITTTTISLVSNNKLKATGQSTIQEIKIADKVGHIKRRLKFKNGQSTQTVDVSGLPSDVYTVSVFDGVKWRTTKIIVR